jgi:hypothetical protein
MGSKADGVLRVAASRPQLAKVPGQSVFHLLTLAHAAGDLLLLKQSAT